ncbi:MAG: hypothetical protein ACLVAW_10145 [Eisenbergiella massiliensis]
MKNMRQRQMTWTFSVCDWFKACESIEAAWRRALVPLAQADML